MQQLSLLQQVDEANNSKPIKKIDDEITTVLEVEDLKWQQRVKKNWYQLGDKNTKFFHLCVTQCHKKNKIAAIQSEDGQPVKTWNEIEEVLVQHFQNLFMNS